MSNNETKANEAGLEPQVEVAVSRGNAVIQYAFGLHLLAEFSDLFAFYVLLLTELPQLPCQRLS